MNKRRSLSDLKHGQPHLLVVPSDQVLRAALSLYMEDSDLPMPTPEEMLICNQHTTTEEVPYFTPYLLVSMGSSVYYNDLNFIGESSVAESCM